MRLIDADELKKQAYKSSDWSHGEHPYVVEVDDIDEAPTVDAEPVRHGHWENGFCSICRELNPTCQLNESTLEYEEVYLYYCPNCGAKMIGGSDEE